MTTHTNPSPGPQRIAITAGDPSGIGAEIIVKTIGELQPAIRARLVVICDRALLTSAAQAASVDIGDVDLDDREVLSASDIFLGQPGLSSGKAQVAYLERAIEMVNDGEIGALVTAPINKAVAREAGFAFSGHTDFLAARLGAERVAMLFVGPTLRVILATVHIPLAEVSSTLDQARIIKAIELGHDALVSQLGITSPRIGVLGLNPHAGERGLLGTEEIEIIGPAIEEARRRLGSNATLIGPLVPDAAFRQPVDLFVAMYHDQALIPIKLVDFEKTVNVTVGLPIIRTSPDHGTAYDIAGRNIAHHQSFATALDLAVKMLDKKLKA